MPKQVSIKVFCLLFITPLILYWSVSFCAGINYQKKPLKGYSAWGQSVQKTFDGGYIIAGTRWRLGRWYSDVYLVKTDADGNETWSKAFGGNNVNWGYRAQQTTDRGYIVVGTSWKSAGNGSDVLLIKTDTDGNKLWRKIFGAGMRDRGYFVYQTMDCGYIITGETMPSRGGKGDVYLIKTDIDGNEVWGKALGGRNMDRGYSVQQTRDGGFIIVGEMESAGSGKIDILLIKTDAHGQEIWSKTFKEEHDATGRSVQQTTDGGYIIAGTIWGLSGKGSDVLLIKTNPDGNKLWAATFGGSHGDNGYSVQQTLDGGYVVAGNTWPFGKIGSSSVYLIKTDGNGGKVWAKTFGGQRFAYGYSVCQTADGGYIIAGKTNSLGADDDKIYLIKTDPNGKERWSKTFQ
jgi:hypothetical protein